MKPVFLLLFPFLIAGCRDTEKENLPITQEAQEPAMLNYTITNVYPHNPESFTEGLEWHEGYLYEGTGDTEYKGKSKLAKIELSTGKDIQQLHLSREYFGEGITLLNGKIYQLTYQTGKCFVYDAKTFKKIKEFSYEGEGWGLTNDGKLLIMNNKTNNLIFRNPETFEIVKTVPVTDNNGPVNSINEMEYVDGIIYSNIWLTNYIIRIDPNTGKVLAKADFSYLLNKYAPGAVSDQDQQNTAVLNGIAYDPVGKRFFITGKLWPKLFEVKFN
ncbi:MAG: hypothetical protein RLZZ28_1383 [Bacteroidota bacterium]